MSELDPTLEVKRVPEKEGEWCWVNSKGDIYRLLKEGVDHYCIRPNGRKGRMNWISWQFIQSEFDEKHQKKEMEDWLNHPEKWTEYKRIDAPDTGMDVLEKKESEDEQKETR